MIGLNSAVTNFHTGGPYTDAPNTTFDYMSVVAHEVGHALGMLHYVAEDGNPAGQGEPTVDEVCTNGTNNPVVW